MSHDALLERNNADLQDAMTHDNVVTRAQQGHLTLLDWQPANPLEEAARMPRGRRSRWNLGWYETGVIVLFISSLIAGADVLTHMAG